ncbi:SpoIID/LytB domain-containing protein [cf. Phormidesmis sp. LEGE 11477]|uniref:SpoIID/LytB domain-containing protein n=1 Tax=cf. Phormidesmis sp. LEGE 11477 TaxID=1828680 RepID=UPI0018830EDA|nr:SpoIID/LytB domain-containing protein [cf. Phormidesmis sp. LEGE 11477]MBE9063318.1 SpoIID/LytB domain-containing protein [cf. Phormidesmis sp. LEGE 11477]
MSANSDSFAKNWLFGLVNNHPKTNEPITGSSWDKPALRWSMRWWGGMLLWLLLVLPAQAAVELRVAIGQERDAITIGSSTAAIIRNGSGEALYQLPQLQGVSVKSDAFDVDLVSNGTTLSESSAFWLEPAEDGFVWIGDKWYRGRVQVTQEGGELLAINHVDLEDYLYSVVGSEMPTSWPQAALQSQAVAARSYALYKQSRSKYPLYDLDATTAYQVYKGIEQEHPNTITAVDSTANQVVTYNGQIIEAIFHSSSGGGTENAADVWSSDVPYLRSVQDFDQGSPVYSWKETFTLAEFSTKIGGIGRVHTIGTAQLTPGGRVASITFAGADGTKTLRGRDVRSALRLRSTRFDIDLNEETETITITGSGFGHGVGMSQWGARSLAEQGWDYERILNHYYQSTVVAQLEN